MKPDILLRLAVSLAVALLTSCGTWYASRTYPPDSDADAVGPKSMYHRVPVAGSGETFSCSFIEFDHSGDALAPEQLEDCLDRIESIPSSRTPLVFIYCHGWHNNSQSGDVEKFRKLLAHFASLEEVGYAVHGVYLAWPGSSFSVPGRGPMEDVDRAAAPDAGSALESLWVFNYWAKKRLAASRIGPSPRFQDTIARICEKTHGRDGRVVATGHSFGALVLERALASDMLRDADQPPGTGPLPDLMFFFNSAAQATDAFQSVAALKASGKDGSRPRVVSVTSPRDFATSFAHKVGNSLAGFSQWNQRWYFGRYPKTLELFRNEMDRTLGWTLDPDAMGKMQEEWFWRGKIHTAEFRRTAPGHCGPLISHGFDLAREQEATGEAEDPGDFSRAAVFNLSSEPETIPDDPRPDPVLTCVVPVREGGQTINQTWNLHPIFRKSDPDLKNAFVNQSAYWVIPLPDAFVTDPEKGISTHGDVWEKGHFLLMSSFMNAADVISADRVRQAAPQIEKAIEAETKSQSAELGPPEDPNTAAAEGTLDSELPRS